MDLTGREVFYSFYDRTSQAELLTRSATASAATVALPQITGDDLFDLQQSTSRLRTSLLIGYYVGQGYVELSDGNVSIMSAPRTLVADADNGPEEVALDITLPNGAIMVTMRGAPGIPIWQALGMTLAEYRAEQAAAGAAAGATAGQTAGATAGAAAGGPAGAAAGQTAGAAAGTTAGANAGAAAGAAAGTDAVAPAIANANAAAANANAALAPAVATATGKAAEATARAAEAATSRDVVTQFAGVSKTYGTYALADADKANVAANAYVLVLADEGRGQRSTVYQKAAGALTFINEIAKGGWNVFIAYKGDFFIRAAVAAALAAGSGTVMFAPGKQVMTAALPAASYLGYVGIKPQITFGVIPDNPWTYPDANAGTVLVGDGTFPCFAGNNVAAADRDPPFTTVDQQTFGNAALKGFSIRNVGIDTFSRGLDLGSRNVAGVMYGELSYIWVRNCTDWGVNLVNIMHTPVHHIWVCSDKAAANGHAFRMVADVHPGILIPGNLCLGDIYVYQGNLTKYGIRLGAVQGATLNQVTTSGRIQCNRFGGETVNQVATMAAGSTAIGVTDTSKFPLGMPVTVSVTANGFTANRAYFVRSRSVDTGAGTITLADREAPYYFGGALSSGAEIAATGNTAVNILTSGMPHLSLVGGMAATLASGTGLVLHSALGHLDLEGGSTIALHLENVGNCGAFDLVEVTTASLINAVFRRVVNSKLLIGKEAITDIDSGSASTIVMGSVKTFGNIRGFGMVYDFTDDRGTLHLRATGGAKPDFAAHYLSGGSGIQTGATLLKNVATPTGGVINLDMGRAGVLPITFGGVNTLTLPTITNAAVKNTWVGVPFEIVALAASVTINTDGTQTYNGVAGKTSLTIPQGGSAQLCAITGASGALHWAILGGKDVDVVRISPPPNYDPPSIALGARITRTYTATGAQLGDRVEVALSVDQQGMVLNAYVSAADTVTIDYVNPPWSTGAIDLPAHSIYVTVRRRA